jgi:hypothetical protein
MTKLERIKHRLFKAAPTAARVEQRYTEDEAKPLPIHDQPIAHPEPQIVAPETRNYQEVEFNLRSDLEACAKGLKIPVETIEKWISAGLLFPDEIKAAQKILKIMRKNH